MLFFEIARTELEKMRRRIDVGVEEGERRPSDSGKRK